MKSSKLKIVIGILLLAAVVFSIKNREALGAYLSQFLEWVQSVGPLGAVALGAVYILACVLFCPGSILTLGAGFAFGVVVGTITVSIASTLGAAAAFLLGRTLLREAIEGKVAGNQKFKAIDSAVGQQGFKIVLLTRLSPVFPFSLLNYAFGLTKVSFRDYFFGSWIGMLPGTVMYVYFGSAIKSVADLAAGNVEGGNGQKALFAVGLVATIAVTVFITRIARKALSEAVPPSEAAAAK